MNKLDEKIIDKEQQCQSAYLSEVYLWSEYEQDILRRQEKWQKHKEEKDEKGLEQSV